MAPRIQFQTVTTKKYTRMQWSNDYGQTWNEPKDARETDVIAGYARVAAKAAAVAQMAQVKRTQVTGMHGRIVR